MTEWSKRVMKIRDCFCISKNVITLFKPYYLAFKTIINVTYSTLCEIFFIIDNTRHYFPRTVEYAYSTVC